MGDTQTPDSINLEEKRDEAGLATVGRSDRGSFKRSDKPKPKPRKKRSSGGSTPKGSGSWGKGKYDENKHKRDENGKFAKKQGTKKKASESSSKKRNPKTSIGRGDGYEQNTENAAKVKKVQAALIKAGLLSTKGGGADGKFGPLTEAAIKKWQKKNGYEPNGVMGVGQMKEITTGKKGLAGRMYRERQKQNSAKKRTSSKKRSGSMKRTDGKTSKPSSGRSSVPKAKTGSTPKAKPKSTAPKKNQTNMYSPDKAERQKLEQMARRNQQIERLIDLLFREQELAYKTDGVNGIIETKVRRVRTPAGERHFDQPIGTIIIADAPLSFIRIGNSDFAGWDKVDGQDGKEYYVGQFDGEKGFVATDANDNVVLEADTMDDLYQSLDQKVGAALDPKAPGDLTVVASDYPGWSKIRGGSGKHYYVGKFDGEDNYVLTDVDDNVIAEGSTIREVQAALKNHDRKQTSTPKESEVDSGSDLDALFRKPGFEMKQEIAAMSSDERRELLREAREQKKNDKKFIFLADSIREAGEGHMLTGKELLSAWKATVVRQHWTDKDLKNVSDYVNRHDFEEWHEDNSAKIAITNEVARRKTAEREKVNAVKTGKLDADNIGTFVENGPSNMSDEDRKKIREWAATASKDDLRVATSAVGAKSRGDRRKASTTRAGTALAILREQERLNGERDREDKRKRDHRKRAENHFARGGPMMDRAARLLGNPKHANPDILNWDDLLALSTQMSGVIDSYRGVGRNEEADKLLAMALEAQSRRDQLQREVDEFINANAAGRKRLSMKFEALDPIEQDQFLGILGVTFVNGDRNNERKGQLESIIRNKNADAVNLAPIKTALQRYVVQSQKNSNPEGSRQRFTEGLEDLTEAGDVYSLYKLLEMLEKTKGNDRATPEMIARMDEMIPLVKNGIERAEDAKDLRRKRQVKSQGEVMPTTDNNAHSDAETTEERKSLGSIALNYDQTRMYEQFDRAVEAKDAQTMHVVGKRILNDAKANGAREGVISFVEDILNDKE